ncbi:hypothetical protein R6Q57_020154 [Mikania cordata]
MIRSPNFHIRKRKWKTVLFLLRKRKRKIEEPCNYVKPPIDAANLEGKDGGDSRWLVDDHDDGDGYCSVAEERDENPRNVVDREFEGFEMENPSLELHRDDEVDESLKSASLIVSERKKDGGDTPPDDDCCPICFDNFSIACKTNCGHWFCANCILQFWTYRTVLKKCNCPICARPIGKLTPEASLLMMHEVEVIEVLKKVQRYNRLFQGGINGVIRVGLHYLSLLIVTMRSLIISTILSLLSSSLSLSFSLFSPLFSGFLFFFTY